MTTIDPVRLLQAAELLKRYAEFISQHVKAADLELHPYQPEVEEAAAYLAALSMPTDASPGWQPIETAPQTGEHILVSDFRDGEFGFGFCGGIRQPWQDVVHWFDDPEMPGLYSSTFGGDQPRPVTHCTHWKRLDVRPIDRTAGEAPSGTLSRPGYDALWLWFGLGRPSWLTLPRVLMHEMPDDWQARMAALLSEWDARWVNQPDITPHVVVKHGNKFAKIPSFLLNYRRPDRDAIDRMGGKTPR